MIIHKCDRKSCGARHVQQRGERATTPPGWYSLNLTTYGHNNVYYELCEKCRERLGIPHMVNDQTVGEKLLEILEDLVTEAVEAQP